MEERKRAEEQDAAYASDFDVLDLFHEPEKPDAKAVPDCQSKVRVPVARRCD
jgi:hypothetical protein